MSSGKAIPTEVCDPRCFALRPRISAETALTEAGDHKRKVFPFDPTTVLPGRKRRVEATLMERRLVPYWHVNCSSHFDYSSVTEYPIIAQNPQAKEIYLPGPDGLKSYAVDTTRRAEGRVMISGLEHCIVRKREVDWIDSYLRWPDPPPDRVQEFQKREQEHKQRLKDYTEKHEPIEVVDFSAFFQALQVDGEALFADSVPTTITVPLEKADIIVQRTLKAVMESISAEYIHSWGLRVETINLYFRPLYVFEFKQYDVQDREVREKRVEELDGLNRNLWTPLPTTGRPKSDIPWAEILKLSTDLGLVLLRDVSGVGQILELGKVLQDHLPEIAKEMRSA
jgi:hypothetical protein